MLSVSNIAWAPDEEEGAAALLAQRGIQYVDVAPGRYFSDPAGATDHEIAAARQWWERRGFKIAGMQSLLFGTQGLNLFADPHDAMLDRLGAVCRIGAGLGARALTFGSPRQRDRSGLDDAAVEAIALDFFRRLGDRAASEGVIVCLEPNAAVYGSNFMINNGDTAAMVRAVAHLAIALQLDVGNLALNAEPAAVTIAAVAPLVGHIHLSEPLLKPLGDGDAPHGEAAKAIHALLPGSIMTIEMVRAEGESALAAVDRAIGFARRTYDAEPGAC